MALVVFGPLVSDVRGSVAGSIFSANKAGPYCRGWAKGPNPNSDLQSAQRRRCSSMAIAWRGLTQVQRDAWDTWAALPAQKKTNPLGEDYYISGFNWFVAINSRLLFAARAYRSTPPALAKPAAPTITLVRFNDTAGAQTSRVTFPWNEFSGYDCILFVALSNSVGVLNKYPGWRSMLAGAPDAANYHDFQAELEAAFGTIQIGQRGFIRMSRQTTDGMRSDAATGYADVITGP